MPDEILNDVLPVFAARGSADTAISWQAQSDDPRIPIVAYIAGWGNPLSARADLDHAHASALANLAKIDVDVTPLETPGLAGSLWLVSGHRHAAEKILDSQFRARLEARVGSSLLAVGAPHAGMMVVASAEHARSVSRAVYAAFLDHEQADEGWTTRISPIVWILDEGTIVDAIEPPSPVVPTLTGRAEAIAEGLAWRALHDDPSLPVVTYLPAYFGARPLRAASVASRDEVHVAAMEQVSRDQGAVEIVPLDLADGSGTVHVIAGATLLAIHAFDPAVVARLQAQLGCERFAIGAPRQDLLLACPADSPALSTLVALCAIANKDDRLSSTAVSPTVWIQRGMAIEGQAKASPSMLDATAASLRLARVCMRAGRGVGPELGASVVFEIEAAERPTPRRNRTVALAIAIVAALVAIAHWWSTSAAIDLIAGAGIASAASAVAIGSLAIRARPGAMTVLQRRLAIFAWLAIGSVPIGVLRGPLAACSSILTSAALWWALKRRTARRG